MAMLYLRNKPIGAISSGGGGGGSYTEGDGIDISAQNEISVDTAFTEASTRTNIASGDTFSTILGKIKKFFTDLKAVAFSGAAEDVTYGSGSVKDALDELNPGSVSVTADGVKTYGQLFNALFSLADESKIGRSSSIVIIDQVFFTNRDGENGIYEFAFFNMAKQSPFLFLYRLRISNNSEMVVFNPSGYSDETSSIPASGAKITLYY